MQKRNPSKIISLVLLLSFSFFQINSAFAAVTPPPVGGNQGPPPTDNQTFKNPLGSSVDYLDVVANIIEVVLGVVGVLALLVFIYGGIVWMTSLGNSERVKLGRDTLIWASLGLVVVFASFAIVNLILSAFKT